MIKSQDTLKHRVIINIFTVFCAVILFWKERIGVTKLRKGEQFKLYILEIYLKWLLFGIFFFFHAALPFFDQIMSINAPLAAYFFKESWITVSRKVLKGSEPEIILRRGDQNYKHAYRLRVFIPGLILISSKGYNDWSK